MKYFTLAFYYFFIAIIYGANADEPNPNRFFVLGTEGSTEKESSAKGVARNNGGSVPTWIGGGSKGKKKTFVIELPPNAQEAQLTKLKREMLQKGLKLERDEPVYPTEHAESVNGAYNRNLARKLRWGVYDTFDGNYPSPDYLPTNMTHPICIIDSGYMMANVDLPQDATNADPNQAPGAANSFDVDHCGHGTHVAGVVAAFDEGNVFLVRGVYPGAPGIKIVKVLGDNSRSTGDDDVRCGFTYTSTILHAAEYCRDSGAKIINLSLGIYAYSETQEDFWQDLFDIDGMLTIAAAGNDWYGYYPGWHYYPASYSSVISVAATKSDKTIAGFSQHNDEVDIAAPGQDILSTFGIGTGTATMSGTSMAAPHVSGVALLLWNKYPNCTNVDIRTAMERTAEDLGDPGRDDHFGHGLLRYYEAEACLADTTYPCCTGPAPPTSSPTSAPITPAPTACPDTTFSVILNTDNYGSETSWTVTDESGALHAHGPITNEYFPDRQYVETYCVPAGACTFTIEDQFNDGMCCTYGEGSYQVYANGTLKGEGGSFSTNETVDLCAADIGGVNSTAGGGGSPTGGVNSDPIILGLRNQVFKFEGRNGAWYSNLSNKYLQWNMQFREFDSCPDEENMFVSGMTLTTLDELTRSGLYSDILIMTTLEPTPHCQNDPNLVCLGEGTLHISFDGGKTFSSSPGEFPYGSRNRVVAHNTYAACSHKWHDYDVSSTNDWRSVRYGGRRATAKQKKAVQLLADGKATMIDPLGCDKWIEDRVNKNDLFQQRGLWSTIYVETPMVSFHIEYRRSDWFDHKCDFQSLDAWMTSVDKAMDKTEWHGILGETKHRIYDLSTGEQIMSDRSKLLRGKADSDYEVEGPFDKNFAALGKQNGINRAVSSVIESVEKSMFSSTKLRV